MPSLKDLRNRISVLNQQKNNICDENGCSSKT